MNAPASSGTSDSGAAAGSDSEQGSGSSGEQESTEKTYTVTLTSADAEMGKVRFVGKNAAATITKTVTEGTEMFLKAVPETGYEFESWSDGNTDSNRFVKVTNDINLIATFKVTETEDAGSADTTYTILVESTDDSMGKVAIGDGVASDNMASNVAPGTEVTIKAVPKKGYVFVKWSDGDTNDTRTVTVTSDITLKAQFGVDYN